MDEVEGELFVDFAVVLVRIGNGHGRADEEVADVAVGAIIERKSHAISRSGVAKVRLMECSTCRLIDEVDGDLIAGKFFALKDNSDNKGYPIAIDG